MCVAGVQDVLAKLRLGERCDAGRVRSEIKTS